MMANEYEFQQDEDFHAWFEKNEEQIYKMERSDLSELLWEAWFGGYQAGLDKMADMVRPLWSAPPKTTDFDDPESVDTDTDSAQYKYKAGGVLAIT